MYGSFTKAACTEIRELIMSVRSFSRSNCGPRRERRLAAPARTLLPGRERHRIAGSRVAAVARHVVEQVHAKLRFRQDAGDRDPVLDLRCARPEHRVRLAEKRLRVARQERLQDAVVERLVDDEVTEPSRGANGDALVAVTARYSAADRPAEIVAPFRRWLVR